MWLGFHNDLADSKSDDLVARQSTRLKAVGSQGGQSTYDPNMIKAWVGGRATRTSLDLQVLQPHVD